MKHKIFIYDTSMKGHMTEYLRAPIGESYDDCIRYLKKLGTTYYTLYNIDDNDTFLFYVPSIGKNKFIIKPIENEI